MEDEARDILRAALATADLPASNLADAIRARLQPVGAKIDLPVRKPIRDAPDFGA